MEDYPFVIGQFSLTKDETWSIALPLAFKLRYEDKQMVLWRPGFTLFLTVWNNDKRESIESRLAFFKSSASTGAYDVTTEADGNLARFSYRLVEPANDKRAPAFYCFVFNPEGHVQASMYFDSEDDVALAQLLFRSIGNAQPTRKDISIFSNTCIASKDIFGGGKQLGVMYRDEPESPTDSGWQFFSGLESDEYVNDPNNLRLLAVALVAEKYPEIIPLVDSPNGTEYMRSNGQLRKS